MPRRVYIETYGCQMNVADTELMFGVLLQDGFERTDAPDDADVMLVNTCAVRDNAEQRVVGRVGELMRHKRAGDVLGVVGCMAQRLGHLRCWHRCRGSTWWPAPTPTGTLPELLAQAAAGRRVADTGFRSSRSTTRTCPRCVTARPPSSSPCSGAAIIKCTFCIVPYTRGPERSRRLEDVVRRGAAGSSPPAPARSRCWARR
ncbi:MAG: hypothetical protein MZU79_00535 [Anaerotruncus sp.]|nr:hypothetical protein [Anaerotruncus sp.]